MNKLNQKLHLAKQIHKYLSLIIHQKFSHCLPLMMINITDIKVSNDMSVVEIYYSSLDDDQEALKALLKKHQKKIKYYLAMELTARRCPTLIFKYDQQLAKIAKMEHLLDSLKQNN